ncbi:MAG: hypothetical protein RR370_03810, partial [Synergistaceae bacterium]
MAASYQAIAVGVYSNIQSILQMDKPGDWLKIKVQDFYASEVFIKNTTPGVRSIPRFKDLSLFGVEYFKP